MAHSEALDGGIRMTHFDNAGERLLSLIDADRAFCDCGSNRKCNACEKYCVAHGDALVALSLLGDLDSMLHCFVGVVRVLERRTRRLRHSASDIDMVNL